MEVLAQYSLVVGQRGPLAVLNEGNMQRALNCGGDVGEQNGGWLVQKGAGEGGRRARATKKQRKGASGGRSGLSFSLQLRS